MYMNATKYSITTQAQVRASFWEACGFDRDKERAIKRQRPTKDYRTDVRCAFVDYVDSLHRDGQISDKLAHHVNLD
jgi:hypothetical protein